MYTIERPLHLGAAVAGRLDDLAKPYTAFGIPLGEAFQLRDDLLGAFGDPDLLGKSVGDDLRDGKPTALYAYARERATGAGADLLADRYGRPDLTAEEIDAMLEVFESTGARGSIESAIDALRAEALTALADAPIPAQAGAELAALADFVVDRDR